MAVLPTVLYGSSFAHHGTYSSYFRLLHYLPELPRVTASLNWPRRLPKFLSDRIYYRWYRRLETRLRPFYAGADPRCFHYLYPENTLFSGADWKGPHRLVLTAHQPESFLRPALAAGETPFTRALRQADGLILLARPSFGYYRQLVPAARLEVIPHGVDVDFFTPAPAAGKSPVVLTVGSWLRDFRCWAEVARRVQAARTEVEFVVVANPALLREIREKHLWPGARVRLLSGLSDEGLRDLYRESTLAFLPLQAAEANNAVLESLAMGLPLLASGLPAVREYAGDTAGYFENAEPAAIADRMLAWLRDDAALRQRGQAARQQAEEKFAWARVADLHRQFYAAVLPGA